VPLAGRWCSCIGPSKHQRHLRRMGQVGRAGHALFFTPFAPLCLGVLVVNQLALPFAPSRLRGIRPSFSPWCLGVVVVNRLALPLAPSRLRGIQGGPTVGLDDDGFSWGVGACPARAAARGLPLATPPWGYAPLEPPILGVPVPLAGRWCSCIGPSKHQRHLRRMGQVGRAGPAPF